MTTAAAKKTSALPISYDDVLAAVARLKDILPPTPAEPIAESEVAAIFVSVKTRPLPATCRR